MSLNLYNKIRQWKGKCDLTGSKIAAHSQPWNFSLLKINWKKYSDSTDYIEEQLAKFGWEV